MSIREREGKPSYREGRRKRLIQKSIRKKRENQRIERVMKGAGFRISDWKNDRGRVKEQVKRSIRKLIRKKRVKKKGLKGER